MTDILFSPGRRTDGAAVDRADGVAGDGASLGRAPQDGRAIGTRPAAATRARAFDDASVVLTRRTHVARVHLWSVAKVAIVFWSLIAALFAGTTFITWTYLSASGAIDNAEQFVADLTGLEEFTIMSATLGTVLLALAGLFVIVAVTLTVAAAAFYNVLSRAVGGIEVTTTEALPTRRQHQHATLLPSGDGHSSDGHAA